MLDIKDIKLVAFDLDGTVYYGDELIEGANDTIGFFRKNGCKVCFLTNNSTKTRMQIFEKLHGIGVKCEPNEVMTSGFVAADYVRKRNISNVYISGSENLIREFEGLGVNVVDEGKAENLVIGYNPMFSYDDLAKAVRVAVKAQMILACNKEKLYPGKDKVLMPGCGAMVAAIEFCADRKADIVTGKPNTDMINFVSQYYNTEITHTLMVGDTYESDMVMAINAKAMSVYVGKERYDNVISVKSIKEIPTIIKNRKVV